MIYLQHGGGDGGGGHLLEVAPPALLRALLEAALHYAAAYEISMALRVPKFDQAELDAAAARRMAGGG